jgi:hypothetical protein
MRKGHEKDLKRETGCKWKNIVNMDVKEITYYVDNKENVGYKQ